MQAGRECCRLSAPEGGSIGCGPPTSVKESWGIEPAAPCSCVRVGKTYCACRFVPHNKDSLPEKPDSDEGGGEASVWTKQVASRLKDTCSITDSGGTHAPMHSLSLHQLLVCTCHPHCSSMDGDDDQLVQSSDCVGMPCERVDGKGKEKEDREVMKQRTRWDSIFWADCAAMCVQVRKGWTTPGQLA